MKQMTEKEIKKRKRRKGYGWVYGIGVVMVIGGVMAYGAVGVIAFGFDETSSLSMLAMIPPMTIIYALAMRPVLRQLSIRIEKLTDAMDEVADGNLDYKIDMKNAGEYEDVYEKFNSMTLELKRTKEEMEAFTNEFAHEFKTPITAISGFADNLLETGEGVETKERMEQLQMISEESKRLLNLSMNTLLLSKVEAMQVVSDKESYDLAEQLRRCVILLDKQMEKKKIELEMDEDLSLPIVANEELLQHVWMNLLNNAIKFTKERGRITITGGCKDDFVIVRITDDGIGMDEETVKKIFDKYYQHDTTSVAKGSGIGLAIVKRIVSLCGGTIEVASWVGGGSSFTVKLPRK